MYKTLEDLHEHIHALTKERILMKFEQINLLLKRVNLEEDLTIKQSMLDAINQYLVVIGQGETKVDISHTVVADVTNAIVAEEVKQEPVAGIVDTELAQAPTLNEIAQVTDKVEIIHVTDKTPVAEEVKAEEAPATEEATQPVTEAPEQKEEAAVEPTVEPTEEAKATEEVVKYVEEFGMISTSSEDHLRTMFTEGGVLHQDKRSFFLNLFLNDELIAVGKSISVKEFPEAIQKHIKAGGIVTCEVHDFTEPKKRSRARYSDVTFSNLVALPADNQISINIKNLLEHGVLPEHAKEEEAPATPVQAAPVKEEKAEAVVEAAKEEAPVKQGTNFLVKPNFVPTFENNKEAVLQMKYGVQSDKGIARLFTTSANGTVVIAVEENTAIEPNKYLAQIKDYTMTTEDKRTFADFSLELSPVDAPAVKEEPKAEAAPVAEEVKVAEPTQEAPKAEPVVQETPAPVVEPQVETAPEVTATPDELLNKPYNPEEARELINPTANADHVQGYQELVNSQAKDMGGAIEEIRTQTAVTPTDRQEITGTVSNVISQTLKDTNMQARVEPKSTTAVMGNLQDGAGNLTETEMVIQFATTFNEDAWKKSLGKNIPLYSRLENNGGPMTSKLVQMVGKNNQVVGQARVAITEALLMDGSQHTATLVGIENIVQQQQGFIVALRFNNFVKVA